jgi:nitrate reductase gamma subunit
MMICFGGGELYGVALVLAIITYLAVLTFVSGLIYQIVKWGKAGMPFHLTLFPAPAGHGRAVGKVLLDSFLFRSLWKRNMEVWISGWLFHLFLAILLIGHIMGISTAGLEFAGLGLTDQASVNLSEILGLISGAALLAAVLYLLLRRLVFPNLRLISSLEDYTVLVWLLTIIASGMVMRFSGGLDLTAAANFLNGLAAFRPVAPPDNPWFITHFVLVMVFLIYFPFSKLVHSCGIFMNRWVITRAYQRQVLWK